MANPLAASVASASIDVLLARDWRLEVQRIESGLQSGLSSLVDEDGVADVRVLGAIGVVQLQSPVDMSAATEAAVREGVWLRPFRDLVYTMPPYVCTDDDVAQICAGVRAAVRATS